MDNTYPSYDYPSYELVNEFSLLIRFSEELDDEASDNIIRASNYAPQLLPGGLTDIIPSYTSLMIVFDPLVFPPETVKQKFQTAWPEIQQQPLAKRSDQPVIEIPTCYDPSVGPDLLMVAEQLQLPWQELVALHSSTDYRVYTLGFSPGFAFMGQLDPKLRIPRKSTPRTRVPAGSVAIADFQTAVYPRQSPGGWHLIGRTPLRLFTPDRQPPALLQPGDRVRFTPIDLEQFSSLGGELDGDWV